MKTGRLSNEEKYFIDKNSDSMTAEQIADQLDRKVEPIIKELKKLGKTTNKKQTYALQSEEDIKKSPEWKQLKAQFTESELELFLYHWKETMAQFRKDVLHTERQQIIRTITLMLKCDQALRKEKETEDRERVLSALVEEERAKDKEDRDMDMILNLERQIASYRAARESLSRDFKDLHTKQEKAFEKLKATREQRIQKLENNKTTLSGLIKALLEDPEFYQKEGKELEKMRLAMEQQKWKHADLHKYDDGQLDRPLLNSETVFYEKEEE